MSSFLTLAGAASAELIVKKSRFLATVSPLADAGQAAAMLAAVRKQHWDASHHCYAYILGERSDTQKFSDDGEPQGTAGMPILDVLQKRRLTDVIAIVTRYFGGVLLGTGGLVRAYGGACAAAVDNAQICAMALTERLRLTIDYPLYERVERYLATQQVQRGDSAFEAQVTLTIGCKQEGAQVLRQAITDLCEGQTRWELLETTRAAWPI